jgi:CRP-like cAMP-binding protein
MTTTMTTTKNALTGNFILDALPQGERERLSAHLQAVDFERNQVLCASEEPLTTIYFPSSALIVYQNWDQSGQCVEVSMIGFEGIIEPVTLFSYNSASWKLSVLIAGKGYQISAEVFTELLYQSAVLHQKLMAFTYLRFTQLMRSNPCRCLHSIEKRLCRCLLEIHDHIKTPDILITHDQLAMLIGATRPAVNLAVKILEAGRLIHTTCGKVTILDRPGLEVPACQCYTLVQQKFSTYLQP